MGTVLSTRKIEAHPICRKRTLQHVCKGHFFFFETLDEEKKIPFDTFRNAIREKKKKEKFIDFIRIEKKKIKKPNRSKESELDSFFIEQNDNSVFSFSFFFFLISIVQKKFIFLSKTTTTREKKPTLETQITPLFCNSD
jgi:hypothetical protein